MLIVLLILHLLTGIFGLRLLSLDVPGAVMKGDPVWLNCSFDLESDELYSVKWYKNNVEFYRYLPSDDPPSQKYEQLGVYLDLAKSYQGHLYLYRTDLYTEGTYRCEVSAEAPSFQTIREENDIRIYVIPAREPEIIGNKLHYTVGEEVNLSCTTLPSKPVVVLHWYINDQPAPAQYEIPYPHILHYDHLQSSSLGLNFVARKSHFVGGQLKVRCLANYTIISSIISDEYYATNSSKPHLALSSFKSRPSIIGAKARYDVGDLVSVNCSYPKSHDGRHLKWFINDKEMTSFMNSQFSITQFLLMVAEGYILRKTADSHLFENTKAQKVYTRQYTEPIFPEMHKTAFIGLQFVVQTHHFQKGVMRLKCSVVSTAFINKESKNQLIGGGQPSSGLRISEESKKDNNDGGSAQRPTWTLLLFTILLRSTCFAP